MKKSYKYRYFKIEKPYKYGYFKIEKLHRYGYPTNLVVNKTYNADRVLSIFCNNKNNQIGFYFIKNKLFKNTKLS